ncbi:uncharacterized protein LOC143147090 [Ptiloglossa arizonensis]|uniref:uncharacterized protein LOC143147090 n=1 Tax=Ptiloglossa arizonensis TaxID=3350558 RepID=UPI003F9ED148
MRASEMQLSDGDSYVTANEILYDETWIIFDNQKGSRQWVCKAEWVEHMLRPSLYAERIMVTVGWPCTRFIHYSFIEDTVKLSKMTIEKLRENSIFSTTFTIAKHLLHMHTEVRVNGSVISETLPSPFCRT